jgi:hypothetical protein
MTEFVYTPESIRAEEVSMLRALLDPKKKLWDGTPGDCMHGVPPEGEYAYAVAHRGEPDFADLSDMDIGAFPDNCMSCGEDLEPFLGRLLKGLDRADLSTHVDVFALADAASNLAPAW